MLGAHWLRLFFIFARWGESVICIRCGQLRILEKDICDDCRAPYQEELRQITDYVRSHPSVNILEIVRETNIQLNVVLRVLSDGHLVIHYRK